MVFLVGAWGAAGWFFATRPAVAGVIGRWGHILHPLVLIALGLFILIQGGIRPLARTRRPQLSALESRSVTASPAGPRSQVPSCAHQAAIPLPTMPAASPGCASDTLSQSGLDQ